MEEENQIREAPQTKQLHNGISLTDIHYIIFHDVIQKVTKAYRLKIFNFENSHF